MELTPQQLDLFDRNIDGDASDNEQKQLAEALANDVALKQEFELQLKMRQFFAAAKAKKKQESIGRLRAIHEELEAEGHFDEPKIIPFYQTTWFRYAASLTGILIIAGVLFFRSNNTIDTATSIATIQKDSISSPQSIDDKKNTEPSTKSNMKPDAIQYGKPNNTLILFEEYYTPLKDSIAKIPHLYDGLNALEVGDLDKAITQLKMVENSDNVTLKDYADWYLALAYLRNDQKKEAINVLKAIDHNSIYKKQADSLLSKL